MRHLPLQFLAIILILTGCAGRTSFRPFNATTSVSALDEIASRRRLLNNIKSSITILLESPKGKIHLRCDLTVVNGNYWYLKLNGPLGVDLAVIEIEGEHFKMKNIQQGETIEGFTDEVLYIPNFDLELPALKVLAPLLLPYPNIIFPQDWIINEATLVPHGELNLMRSTLAGEEYLELHLDYSPLRVHDEQIQLKGRKIAHRVFIYDSPKSYLPSAVEVSIDGLKLNITYNSISINKSPKKSTQLTPL